MALIHCDFYSETLGMSTSMCVILPQNTRSQVGMEGKAFDTKHKVLYLLHGVSDDHTIWQRRTSIERYVASMGIAVVMPQVGRSYYTDMKHGGKYWTFVSEELPEVARSFFPISDKREDNFVAGLSMGGYGAFKLALRCPDKFCAAASLSGALNAVWFEESSPDELELIFGDLESFLESDDDLFYLAEKLAQKEGPKPRLYQCCGTEDFLYKDNQDFLGLARRLSYDITYEEGPGTHEWGYWDKMIQRALEWLPLKG